jgi:uncharacterized protein
MTTENAKAIVRRLLSGRECALIQFFGGEPGLNLDAVEAAVQETLALVETGNLRRPPRFAIVTNGTFPDIDRALALIARHGFEVTVSLDGPPSVHDELRPSATSAPTHAQVVRALSAMRANGVPVAIESVYTSLHLQRGVSLKDLLVNCQELGVDRLLVDIAHPPVPDELNPLCDPYYDGLIETYREGIRWWFESLLSGSEKILRVYFRDILLPLLDGAAGVNRLYGCGAAARELIVSPEGDAFACQLLYGREEFRLGNVLSGESCGTLAELPVAAEDFDRCRDCYCRHWCQPCVALNHLSGDRQVPFERECGLRRAVIRCIGSLAFERLNVPETAITSELKAALSREADRFGCLSS